MKSRHLTEHFLQRVTAFLTERKRKHWMQNMKLKTGALSRSLGIPEKEDIPMALLQKKKQELQRAASGDKTLSKQDLKLLRRINLAILLKKAHK